MSSGTQTHGRHALVDEDALLGRYVRLRSAARRAEKKLEEFLSLSGPIKRALGDDVHMRKDPQGYSQTIPVSEYGLSIDPDEIIKAAEQLRVKQEDYKRILTELMDFVTKNPRVVKLYGEI
jgi:hypothetical protein